MWTGVTQVQSELNKWSFYGQIIINFSCVRIDQIHMHRYLIVDPTTQDSNVKAREVGSGGRGHNLQFSLAES